MRCPRGEHPPGPGVRNREMPRRTRTNLIRAARLPLAVALLGMACAVISFGPGGIARSRGPSPTERLASAPKSPSEASAAEPLHAGSRAGTEGVPPRRVVPRAPEAGLRARTEGDAYDENGVYWFPARVPPDGPPIPPEPMTDPLQGLALTVEMKWVYRADYDRDGLLDSEDLAWFLDDFHRGRPETDLNRDGLFTAADQAMYLRDYQSRQMMEVGVNAYFPRLRSP